MTTPSVRPRYADTQGHLVITAAPIGANAVIGKRLVDVGELDVEGDYECAIATDGANVIEVELMCSAVTGSFAATLTAQRFVLNFGSNRSGDSDAAANFSAGTPEVITLSDLRGKKWCKVSFSIPGGGAITFDPGADPASPDAIAEYNVL